MKNFCDFLQPSGVLYKDHRVQYGRDRYRMARSTKAWQGWDCGPFYFLLAQARLYAPLDMIAIFRVGLCGCENAIVLGLTTRKDGRAYVSLRAVGAILAQRRTVTSA